MALTFIKNFLCSCAQLEPEHVQDESSRLIPHSVSSPTPPSLNHRRLQERLGTIVRAKEKKMVNVGSRIPFNLHNQPLPHLPHLIPPSSASSGYFDDSIDEEFTPTHRYINYEQDPYPPTPYPQFISSSPTNYGAITGASRSPSPDREPRTVLNVRLVGFTDRRGRNNRREKLDDNDDPIRDHTPRPSNPPEEPSNHVSSQDILNLQDTGVMVLSWGD